MKLTAHAKIQVVVEVEAPGTYDVSWTYDKLLEQAESEAIARLGAALPKGARIIGTPTVVDVVIRRTDS